MTAVAPGFFRGKHLVIFGAGYLGEAVARAAAEQGAVVTALTRNPAKVSGLAAAGCDVVIDELSAESWHAKIRGPVDFALDCVSSGGGGIEGYRRSYVEGMRSILSWARKGRNVGTLVYTGSTSVYPDFGGSRVDETTPIGDSVGTPAVLFEAEQLLRAGAGGACARWFILRLAGLYGPGRHHLLDQVRRGEAEMAGRGDHFLNLIHRDDVTAAILAAFAAPAGIANEVLNVVDDVPARKAEVVGWLARELKMPVPSFTGEPVSGRRPESPNRLIANSKIKELLGWRPAHPDFRAGYRALLEA